MAQSTFPTAVWSVGAKDAVFSRDEARESNSTDDK